jgi:hypothetical protein
VRGQALPDTDHGWEALRAMERDRDTGPQKNVKLLNPQAKVSNVLEMVGFMQFFEVHYDCEKALASF